MKDKLTKKLVTRTDQETRERLDKIAHEESVPPSQIYRRAVREFIERREKKNGRAK